MNLCERLLNHRDGEGPLRARVDASLCNASGNLFARALELGLALLAADLQLALVEDLLDNLGYVGRPE